ncbi:hypothetical protein QN367_15695 [Cryobacterium sp. RTS3]|uniref:hypothetical protein n=1 Tax=Cryobacterium sp. RTS3 TaxID=3048643 RepID=UPI002B23BD13|nr:hypothetical protein [Cryobacterium sp. RTS3]MEB0000526.1 hypothetical protein [Cryobacterium sp. RTS3]
MSKKPVSEWMRLQMFETLAAEFFAIDDALHVPSLKDVTSASEDSTSHWLQFLRVAMLRKFFAKEDQVELRKVADALRTCRLSDDPGVDDAAKAIEQQFGQFSGDDAKSWKALLSSDGSTDAFDDMIYGRLLHADADKFTRTEAMPSVDKHLALFIGVAPLQQAVELSLYNVRICIANGWVGPSRLGP